jgi:hypothetical protein
MKPMDSTILTQRIHHFCGNQSEPNLFPQCAAARAGKMDCNLKAHFFKKSVRVLPPNSFTLEIAPHPAIALRPKLFHAGISGESMTPELCAESVGFTL